jgi:N-acetylmuramoyl-L-alanine amidase
MGVYRALFTVFVLLLVTPASAQPPTVRVDGRPYVELARVARTLDTTLEAKASSARAHLRKPGHLVTLTRDRAEVTVNGRRVVLDAPVRVRGGVWLVPAAFMTRVAPELRAAPAAASARAPAPAPARAPAPAAPRPARAASPAPGITLEDLRFRSYPSFTRVVLETSAAVTYRVDTGRPRQTRVHVSGLAAQGRREELRDGFVDAIALERAGPDVVVTVGFEGQAGDLKAFILADPPRLVLDFMRPAEPEAREHRQDATPLRRIVLDAGHGGHDPGATGPTGLTEKELVLDVTRRVKRLLEDRLEVEVMLSRDGDYFVPLRERTSFANRQRADLFVSIHANAHRESAPEGVEIYFLSSEATDNTARQVAALENAVVQLEAPTPAARKGTDFVRTILWDLAQSEFQFESQHVAGIVLDSMTRSLRMQNRGVKQAGFYVLGGAAMPAVLIEIGFLTNPREERKLRDSRYRDEVARAIAEGLGEYKRLWDQRMQTVLDRGRSPDASR